MSCDVLTRPALQKLNSGFWVVPADWISRPGISGISIDLPGDPFSKTRERVAVSPGRMVSGSRLAVNRGAPLADKARSRNPSVSKRTGFLRCLGIVNRSEERRVGKE